MTAQIAQSPRFRILVITNETARGDELHDAVVATANGHAPAAVLVVAPALNSRLRRLARKLVERAEQRFDLPIAHVIVDGGDARAPATEREKVAA